MLFPLIFKKIFKTSGRSHPWGELKNGAWRPHRQAGAPNYPHRPGRVQTQPPTLPGADVTAGAGRWTGPLQTQKREGAAAASRARLSLLLRRLLTQKAEAWVQHPQSGRHTGPWEIGFELTGWETVPEGLGNAALPSIGTTTLRLRPALSFGPTFLTSSRVVSVSSRLLPV